MAFSDNTTARDEWLRQGTESSEQNRTLSAVAYPLGVKGGRLPTLTAKNLQKSGEGEKIRKKREKEEKLEKRGKIEKVLSFSPS